MFKIDLSGLDNKKHKEVILKPQSTVHVADVF